MTVKQIINVTIEGTIEINLEPGVDSAADSFDFLLEQLSGRRVEIGNKDCAFDLNIARFGFTDGRKIRFYTKED